MRSDQYPDYRFLRLDLADREHIAELFAREKFQRVVHLGAQAGIRYSLVNSSPVRLMDFIEAIEDALQKGDVPATWADTSDLEKTFGYKPATPVKEGIGRFVEWYRRFYGE